MSRDDWVGGGDLSLKHVSASLNRQSVCFDTLSSLHPQYILLIDKEPVICSSNPYYATFPAVSPSQITINSTELHDPAGVIGSSRVLLAKVGKLRAIILHSCCIYSGGANRYPF